MAKSRVQKEVHKVYIGEAGYTKDEVLKMGLLYVMILIIAFLL